MGVVYRPKPTPLTQQPPYASVPWPNPNRYTVGTIWRTRWTKQYWRVQRIHNSVYHRWVWVPASEVPESYEMGMEDFPRGTYPE